MKSADTPSLLESSSFSIQGSVSRYLRSASLHPLFLPGDSLELLKDLPSEVIDCVITSPPYWGHREYAVEGIGLEKDPAAYISSLTTILAEVHRVLRSSGSLWLNLGDTYVKKSLAGIPWRVAITLTDTQGWILRNSVIWNKLKGSPDSSRDKLRNVHENLFHFVKSPQKYFYDADAIRSNPKKSKIVNGAIVSATGVSGVRYKRQLELSTELTPTEKTNAIRALETMLGDVAAGKLADFRMIIRGQQRTTHSSSERVSGRAKELRDKGYYFLKYHPNGSKPADVWDIIPEDTQKRISHFAPYPEDLCRLPILATCPKSGIVLDPFCGTGTTNVVAFKLGRKSIGIDLSQEYLESATSRCALLL